MILVDLGIGILMHRVAPQGSRYLESLSGYGRILPTEDLHRSLVSASRRITTLVEKLTIACLSRWLTRLRRHEIENNVPRLLTPTTCRTEVMDALAGGSETVQANPHPTQ